MVSLVSPRAIARVNEQYLGHQGATDVISFDYRDEAGAEDGGRVVGELLVCPAVAATASARHGTSVGHEVVLYVVHGLLHLAGYDDLTPADRRRMRQAERRALRRLADAGPLDDLFRPCDP
jgi:probable rRNA maturation factor